MKRKVFIAGIVMLLGNDMGCTRHKEPQPKVSLTESLKQPKIVFQSYRDGNAEIYIMNTDGSNQINITNHPADDSDPCWSSDGKKIAFVSNRNSVDKNKNNDIYVMNPDGSDVKQLTRQPEYDGEPAWSPDGSKIAFVSDRGGDGSIDNNGNDEVPNKGNWDIFVMNSDGSNIKRLTTYPGYDWEPAWSPDGNKIAFGSDRDSNKDENWEIYVMNPDGTDVKRLTHHPDDHSCPCWSPDGKKIAFHSNRDGDKVSVNSDRMGSDIYIMNPDGTEVKRLTAQLGYNTGPVWSPDGKWIAFNSKRNKSIDIYKIKPDGSGVKRLTMQSLPDTCPSWSPFPLQSEK